MNQDRNELILAVATEGFWDMNLKTDSLYLSPRYCELVGYCPDDTVFDGAFFRSVVHPDDRDRVFEAIEDHLRQQRSDSLVLEYRMVSRDGTVRWIEGRSKVVARAEDGTASRMVGTIVDISERKLSEETLRKSQSLLENLSLQVPGILFQTNVTAEGEFSTPYASAKSYDIYELAPEEIVDDISTVFNRFHPQDHDRIVTSILESIETLSLWQCEYRVILPRQGLKWLYGIAQPQAMEDGSVVLYGIIMDISDRKRAEELLRMSEQKYSSVFHTSPDAIMLTYVCDGKYLEVNEVFSDISGYTREEAVGQSSLGLNLWVDPSERERLTREIEARGIVKEMEAHFRRKDGSVFVGQISSCSLDINGEPCILSIVRDITQHKEAIREIRDSEKNLRTILDAIPVGMGISDGKTIEYINSAFVRDFGYCLDDVREIEQWFLRAYPDPSYREPLVSAWKSAVEEAMSAGTPIPALEALVTCKDGTVRHTIASTQIIQDRVLVIFTDITAHENTQSELLKIMKLESLGVLAGGIAHDFNNILTGVMGNISLAKMLLQSSHDPSETLDRAEKAAMRAAELARKLLVFAKGGDPVKKTIRLEGVVDEAVTLVLSGTKVKGVMEMDTPLHAVEADEGQISQCLHNIVINAVQAMPEGGKLMVRGANVALDRRNSFGLPRGDYVKISFTDEGCGISEENQKKIFDPYFTTKSGGSGLGLASTCAIIAKHGGHISVTSAVGVGTTFSIYLPSVGKAGPSKPAEEGEETVPHQTGKTILVMDDEPMVRDLAAMTLGHAGFTVKTCENGEEAVALYKKGKEAGDPFAVTIMDLTIPGGMGGVEAARAILSFDPQAVLIVSSGYSEDPVMADFAKYGFRAAMKKPYRAEDIVQVIRDIKES